MVCGCSKNLGCFTKDDVVDTGIVAIGDGDYIFHINYNGQYITETQALLLGDPLTLTNTFNEDAEICFKIEFNILSFIWGRHFNCFIKLFVGSGHFT